MRPGQMIPVSSIPYACGSCGYNSAAQLLVCPRCKKIQTFGTKEAELGPWNPKRLAQIKKDRVQRVKLKDSALDALFGGGPVRSCSYLFSGAPGSGKSSWALQACQFFDAPLYVTGEETTGAIKLRAERFGISLPQAHVVETRDLEIVAKHITTEYDALILDSAHRFRTDDVRAAVGTALQAASVIALCSDIVRKLGMVGFIIGHINKDGDASGMVANEHDVDGTVVLKKHGDSRRFIMTKNRHGPTPIEVECTMTAQGLQDFHLIEEEASEARSE